MEQPAIVTDRLVVVRGRRTVLDGLTFVVPTGRITGLLGPSGGGKTTLLRCIVGVQRIQSGTVQVLGRPAGDPRLRGRIGYVTQAPSIYADLTVRDNLRYFAALADNPLPIPEVLSTVGLADRERDVAGRLSGGQRGRVSLACALVGAPSLLVLDEPTVGLDPVLRRELWQLFHELVAGGATIIVSSHVMDEAARCQRLLLLRDGLLVADDTPAAILASTDAADVEDAFLRIAEREAAPA